MATSNTSKAAQTSLSYAQKLHALAYRFYGGDSQTGWLPVDGDFYTTSRADLELYQVASVDMDRREVWTRYCDPERCGHEVLSCWSFDQFTSFGFGPNRVWVPHWVLDQIPGPDKTV